MSRDRFPTMLKLLLSLTVAGIVPNNPQKRHQLLFHRNIAACTESRILGQPVAKIKKGRDRHTKYFQGTSWMGIQYFFGENFSGLDRGSHRVFQERSLIILSNSNYGVLLSVALARFTARWLW